MITEEIIKKPYSEVIELSQDAYDAIINATIVEINEIIKKGLDENTKVIFIPYTLLELKNIPYSKKQEEIREVIFDKIKESGWKITTYAMVMAYVLI